MKSPPKKDSTKWETVLKHGQLLVCFDGHNADLIANSVACMVNHCVDKGLKVEFVESGSPLECLDEEGNKITLANYRNNLAVFHLKK